MVALVCLRTAASKCDLTHYTCTEKAKWPIQNSGYQINGVIATKVNVCNLLWKMLFRVLNRFHGHYGIVDATKKGQRLDHACPAKTMPRKRGTR